MQLGYVAGAHGVRGALRVKLFNVESSTLEAGMTLWLRPRGEGEGEDRALKLTRVAPKPGSEIVRMWLEGVEGREAAEALRGCELLIAREELPEPEQDEFYLGDLVGAAVLRRREGEGVGEGEAGFDELGEVSGVSSNGMQDLLVIRLRGREWLMPALPVFIEEIDPGGEGEGARVIVDVHDDMLPEGAGAGRGS